METLADRVFRAKLQMELEPADFTVKRMLRGIPEFSTPQEMFVHLRGLHERFWTEMQPAVQLVYDWAHYLGVPDAIGDLKVLIWNNFLCRLSLDARLITSKTAADSNGNQVLRIMIETVENTLLSRLSVTAIIQQQQQPRTIQPSIAGFPTPDVVVDPRELHTVQHSMRNMSLPATSFPGPASRGMPIRLQRTKPESEYAQRKKPPGGGRRKEKSSNKGSRSRKESFARTHDDGDDDEEEVDDDEDDDDMIAKAEERRQ